MIFYGRVATVFLTRVPGNALSPYAVLELCCHSDVYACFLYPAALTRKVCICYVSVLLPQRREHMLPLSSHALGIRALLDNHFLPKVSIILQSYYFGKRKQTDDESIEDFVTALRKLASSCNFGENLEERIRDQFMLECKYDKVREALWAKNDPSLDEVLIIAKQVEHSMSCIENLRKSRNVAMNVQALDTKTNNKL
ncbi:hypothetical protein NDU88_001213 [Pleurodeles waltl]|uniref:Uncharacterized protein n=1 Tax=Pleurodeles waltl TaxID=8319 RepID=A0AAV7LCG3_PLEWA|nr:hypothetical protein NDU88_001213 [Pleurodeles waltl]